MGIFFNNPSMVLEFEVDGKKAEDTANENDYNTDEEEEEVTAPKATENEEKKPDEGNDGVKEDDYDVEKDDDEEGDNTGEEENDNEEESGDNDGVNEDDYTIEDEDGEEEGGDGTGEEGNDNEEESGDNDEESSSENDTNQMDNKLKELEKELFDTLSDEQKQIKIDELKRCYQELHNRCDNIISIINNATPPDENTSRVFEYLNDSMSDLKQYIYDYFTYTFATKEYMENDAQYQKYLAILNSFNTILEELIKKNGKDE